MQSIRVLLAAGMLLVTAQANAATAVYDVNAAYRQEVVDILSTMLAVPGERFGTVQLLPTGQILVDTATEARQNEVAAVLEGIATRGPSETPTITLRYWLLGGAPGADDAAGLPDVLADVVREIETMYGPLGIRVLDAATVSGQAGKEASFSSESLHVKQLAYANANQINAEIEFESGTQNLEVEVSMTRGEFLVLSSGTSSDGVNAVVVNWPAAN